MITIKNMARVVRYDAARQKGYDKAKAKTLGYSREVIDYAQRRQQKINDEARARVLERARNLDW